MSNPEMMEALQALAADKGISVETLFAALADALEADELGAAHAEAVVDAELDVQRFRPNILVEAADDEPFLEDGWLGCVLCIGSLRMRVDKRDGRCVVITIDPATTERNPEILRTVARDRQGCLGVYGSTVEPGRVALNDPVLIESPA